MYFVNHNLIASEENRFKGRSWQRYVDIHCHCLPAVDDGPATMADALALCRALVDDNVMHVIATPHQLGRFNDCNEAAQIREAVSCLNEELRCNGVDLTVAPGGDIRVDERICQLLAADKILTLADCGKHILLELPHEVFIDIEPLLVELAAGGVRVIISHPERHSIIAKKPRILLKWLLEYSVHLQVTAASLLGGFGPLAQSAAWQFLSSGWASLVATDSHDLQSRRPEMKAAFERISVRLGRTIARLVCIENPTRVLRGQDIQTISFVSTGKYSNETVPSIP